MGVRDGNMNRLIVHDEPSLVPDVAFTNWSGEAMTIRDFEGRALVVNFWATWCGPCAKEMPSLYRLQQQFNRESVLVLAVASGRNPPDKVEHFLRKHEVEELTVVFDQLAKFSGANSVRSLPVTLLVDRQGYEVARYLGDTEWDTWEALRAVSMLAELY